MSYTNTRIVRAQRRRNAEQRARLDIWDGRALIFDPHIGKEVDADTMKANAIGPSMAFFDSLPIEWRRLIDDYGDLNMIKFRDHGFSVERVRDMAEKALRGNAA